MTSQCRNSRRLRAFPRTPFIAGVPRRALTAAINLITAQRCIDCERPYPPAPTIASADGQRIAPPCSSHWADLCVRRWSGVCLRAGHGTGSDPRSPAQRLHLEPTVSGGETACVRRGPRFRQSADQSAAHSLRRTFSHCATRRRSGSAAAAAKFGLWSMRPDRDLVDTTSPSLVTGAKAQSST
jgi:hypothetical protein